MKKSTQQDHQYTELYVELVREGMSSEEARKKASKEIYGLDVPQPLIYRSKLKSTDLADLQAMEQDITNS